MNSPETFIATYHCKASDRSEAEEMALAISIEQSVEMPPDAVPSTARHSIAEVVSLVEKDQQIWRTEIRFPGSTVDGDPLQLLNILFGNTSLKRGVRLVDVDNQILNTILPGPQFGIKGIRNLVGVQNRALSCTALKPIGLSPDELAQFAGKFAAGGIDLIKDDHGLLNQQSSPFRDRVKAVVTAIREGEQKSGKRTLYFPNITGSALAMAERFNIAADSGADGVMILPHLSGLSVMQELARKHRLPIMAHPAFAGAHVIAEDHGIAPGMLFGKLWKSFGADAAVYPNSGGRFSFSTEQVQEINRCCRQTNGEFPPIFPVLGGGIQRSNLDKWVDLYEKDTVFLIGGSLYEHPDGPESATREFQQKLESYV
ncbi:MAG: hypothetical protein JJU46_10765 [Balneolaceae bacterium]|nr:hypothetical protein [Balneolaceae bacterium]MCH8549379.1 hypothetical protein [Balneolaceae bacterium]